MRAKSFDPPVSHGDGESWRRRGAVRIRFRRVVEDLDEAVAVGQCGRRLFVEAYLVFRNDHCRADTQLGIAYPVDDDRGVGKRFGKANPASGVG